MDAQFLLLAALVAVAGAIGALWRRIDALTHEVRLLRELLAARADLPAPPAVLTPTRWDAEAPVPAPVSASPADLPSEAADLKFHPDGLSPDDLLASAPDEAPSAPPLGALSDDPFDDSWVLKSPAAPQPAPAYAPAEAQDLNAPRPQTAEAAPRGPLRRASWAPALDFPAASRVHWAFLVGALLAPIPLILLNDRAAMAAGLLGVIGGLVWALRSNSTGVAWLSVGAAILLAPLVLAHGAASAAPILCCFGFAALGAAGVAAAILAPDWRPGAALAAGMIAALTAIAMKIGAAGPAGMAGGLLVLAAASAGAVRQRLDPLLFIGYVGAVALLWTLSAQDHAGVWFTPAMGWTGACFFGLLAARAPQLGPQSVVLAATGAAAPLFAIGGLHLAGHGLARAWMASGAFALTAAGLAGVLVIGARRAGSVKALSLTAWVLASGVATAAFASVALSAPLPFSGAIFAGFALIGVALNRFSRQTLFQTAACLAAIPATACCFLALLALNRTVHALDLATLIVVGFMAPIGILTLAARALRNDSAITRGVLESCIIVSILAALAAIVRLAVTFGAPSAFPVGLSEIGVDVLTWMVMALAIIRYGQGGARQARLFAATALIWASGATCALSLLLWFLGLWDAQTQLGAFAPFGQHAPLGFAAMALAAWLYWDFARRNGEPRTELRAFAAACLLSAAWISFEFSSARPATSDFDLAALSVSGVAFLIACAAIAAKAMRSNLHKDFKRHG